MPAAERRSTPAGQPYGDQARQQEFMRSQVVQPQPIEAQAFAAEPLSPPVPGDIVVPGVELSPEESSVLFGNMFDAEEPSLADVDSSWLPAFAALAQVPGVSDELRALGRVAVRMIEEQDAEA